MKRTHYDKEEDESSTMDDGNDSGGDYDMKEDESSTITFGGCEYSMIPIQPTVSKGNVYFSNNHQSTDRLSVGLSNGAIFCLGEKLKFPGRDESCIRRNNNASYFIINLQSYSAKWIQVDYRKDLPIICLIIDAWKKKIGRNGVRSTSDKLIIMVKGSSTSCHIDRHVHYDTKLKEME